MRRERFAAAIVSGSLLGLLCACATVPAKPADFASASGRTEQKIEHEVWMDHAFHLILPKLDEVAQIPVVPAKPKPPINLDPVLTQGYVPWLINPQASHSDTQADGKWTKDRLLHPEMNHTESSDLNVEAIGLSFAARVFAPRLAESEVDTDGDARWSALFTVLDESKTQVVVGDLTCAVEIPP